MSKTVCALLGGGILFLNSVSGAAEGTAGTWPTFRGTDRSAVSPDTGLLQSWPESGPKLVWEGSGLGRGYSSVAIADGRIYTMGDHLPGAEDQDEYLICLDQNTGKQIWKSKTGEPWTNGQDDWQSARSTPTVDDNHVYCLT
ncbi:MAG: PQQ-binding-like beta-propeller repeat protein, partial [Planctomycetaceae bacterium]|nr:PQQ-binding-like beta-propeller repeat protein [Planctomycetaceae bacterium]